MSEIHPWREFFNNHAPQYMENCFTKGTEGEVEFITDELDLPVGSSILDIGCGTGRHSVELARRGYRVTGIDISEGMLEEAKKAAKTAGVELELINANVVELKSDKSYDAAICMCEGAFALMTPDENPIEHDIAILSNIYDALKPGGKLILTCLSAFRMIRETTQEKIEEGLFDPLTTTEINMMEYEENGGKKEVKVVERGYLPSELYYMFKLLNFQIEYIGGGSAGEFGKRLPRLEEYEIMVIVRKPENP